MPKRVLVVMRLAYDADDLAIREQRAVDIHPADVAAQEIDLAKPDEPSTFHPRVRQRSEVEGWPPARVDGSDGAHDAGALPLAQARRLAVSDIDVVSDAWE